MNKEKQMINDLIEIMDEEYNKRYIITPQNTAKKMTEKGYRKANDLAEEIFEEIDKQIAFFRMYMFLNSGVKAIVNTLDELKKKYTEGCDG